MQQIANWIAEYGLPFVFLNVLLGQAGVPVPIMPTLVVAAALAGRGGGLEWIVLTSVGASLIADLLWYGAGARFGRPVLRLLCRISLSPDSCVRQTENIYTRFGPPSLLFAKFIPGFAAVATAMAGAVRTSRVQFIFFDALGALLYTAVPVAIGMLFHDAVSDLLSTIQEWGEIGVAVVLGALAVFVGMKWWQRRRFFQELRMARISVLELRALIDAGATPVILDVRSAASQASDGRIPGAITIEEATLGSALAGVPDTNEVVVYCACPNEASAARIAKMLKLRGYDRVRPLHGGIDAWVAAGYGIDHGELLMANSL